MNRLASLPKGLPRKAMGGAGGVGMLTGMPQGMAEPMTTSGKKCPFRNLATETILAEGPLALAIRDGYPLNPGHALIVPRRHVASWFDATVAEREEMLRLADDARRIIVERHAPDAFNLGINDGPAAGQTVPHLHLHLIPRYKGDVTDPRGGVRWIIPERAAYWAER